MSGFFRSLPLVLEAEGGLVNDPDDRGGLTNHGVTQDTYDRWRDHAAQPRRSVEHIEDSEIRALYHAFFWVPGNCDALPWPASHLHFDACVNHGIANATRILQRAVGAEDDGQWGPRTRSAVERTAPSILIDGLLWERLRFYSKVAARPGQSKFLRGWLNRVLKLKGFA